MSQNFTEEELQIHIHREACLAKEQMCVDPSSGYEVFTEYAHLQRGECCGSRCRHVYKMLCSPPRPFPKVVDL